MAKLAVVVIEVPEGMSVEEAIWQVRRAASQVQLTPEAVTEAIEKGKPGGKAEPEAEVPVVAPEPPDRPDEPAPEAPLVEIPMTRHGLGRGRDRKYSARNGA